MNRRNFFGVVGAAIAGTVLGIVTPGAIAASGGIESDALGSWGFVPGNSLCLGKDDLLVREFVANEVRISPSGEFWSVGQGLVEADFVLPEPGWIVDVWCDPVLGSFQLGDSLMIRAIDWEKGLIVHSIWFRISGILHEDVSRVHEDVSRGRSAWLLEHVHGGEAGMVIKSGSVLVNAGMPQGVQP